MQKCGGVNVGAGVAGIGTKRSFRVVQNRSGRTGGAHWR